MSIALEGVFKSYQNGNEITDVLKNINLRVEEGEFIAIIGPSGSGKSTLVNIVSCLDRPTRGKYLIDGEDTRNMNDHRLAILRNKFFGFVFQSFNLLPQYTALENVELALLYGNASPRMARKKAKEVLESLGLKDRLNYKPNQLSGGQKQRVAIARAVVNSPCFIIADEPTGSLDSKTGKEVISIFKNLNASGKTIIIVTHDLNIAKEAKRIVRIKDGYLMEA